MEGTQDKSRFGEEDWKFIWEHTESEIPGDYQENYFEALRHMDQQLKKRKRNEITFQNN